MLTYGKDNPDADAWCDEDGHVHGASPGAATPAEVQSFLDTFTTYRDPRALGRRIHWMRNDAAADLPRHAASLVHEVIAGRYSAPRGLLALELGYRHHGGADSDAPRRLLAAALGAVLTQKAA